MHPRSLKQLHLSAHETECVDFKETFDPSSTAEWCELLKDIFAFVNSGGGVILFGVNNDGSPSGRSLTALQRLDPAKLTDKVASYTGIQYHSFTWRTAERGNAPVIALHLEPIPLLLIPTRPGTYPTDKGMQKTAFGKGVVYFRHGAKSEPGTSLDVDSFINRRLRSIRHSWLGSIRRVVAAPPDSTVSVVVSSSQPLPASEMAVATPPVGDVRLTPTEASSPVHLTDDPSAPHLRLVTPDELYPYRALEFVKLVNGELQTHYVTMTVHDLAVLLSTIDRKRAVEFCYMPRHGPKQYSQAYADWIVNQVARNRSFFQLARARYRRERRTTQRKSNHAQSPTPVD